jgi:phosphoribosylcarboxyaminoimidazole (NCAIR) mutase
MGRVTINFISKGTPMDIFSTAITVANVVLLVYVLYRLEVVRSAQRQLELALSIEMAVVHACRSPEEKAEYAKNFKYTYLEMLSTASKDGRQ